LDAGSDPEEAPGVEVAEELDEEQVLLAELLPLWLATESAAE
jgi:hypothetical protein